MSIILLTYPEGVARVVADWRDRRAGVEKKARSSEPGLTSVSEKGNNSFGKGTTRY